MTQVSKRGKRQIIRSVLPGDMLGFQTDLDKSFTYSAIAIEDSVVCCVPDLFMMCSEYPELSLKLLWEELGFLYSTSRIAQLLHHREIDSEQQPISRADCLLLHI